MEQPSKRPKRTRLSPTARRTQLLDIGADVLLNESLDNLTVDRVASEAGVSRGLVFHYFPSVRELHLACMAEVATGLVDIVREAAVHPDARDDPLRRGLDAFIGYIEQWPRTFDAMSIYAAQDEEFGEVFEGFRAQVVDALRGRAGLPDDSVINLLLRSWVSFVEAAVICWIRDTPMPRKELIETLVMIETDLRDHWRSRRAASV